MSLLYTDTFNTNELMKDFQGTFARAERFTVVSVGSSWLYLELGNRDETHGRCLDG